MSANNRLQLLGIATAAALTASAVWTAWKYDFPQRLMDRGVVLLGWSDTVSPQPDASPRSAAGAPPAEPRAQVAMDARRRQLIGVQTVTATTRPFDRTIRASGLVKPDERRIVDVNVKLAGWIRDLHA